VTAEPTDFTITLSESSFSPGDYTLVAEQRGQTPHALSIAGPGVDGTTPVIQPDGGNQELTVTAGGEFELWCPVGDHRDLGMTVTITVS
jgi:plastocyanin